MQNGQEIMGRNKMVRIKRTKFTVTQWGGSAPDIKVIHTQYIPKEHEPLIIVVRKRKDICDWGEQPEREY
jgi:hypothetical protein